MKTTGSFWEYVEISGPLDCWLWKGSVQTSGYGECSWRGHHVLAHRVAALLSGLLTSLFAKVYVLHRCDNHLCCNPVHLFIGNAQNNMDDMLAKGREFRKIALTEYANIS